MKKAMQEFANAFETRKRENGEEFIALKDNSPEWMRDAMQSAHSGMLPNNWTYSLAYQLATHMAESDCDSEDIADAVDASIPVYHSQRLDWVSSHPSRMELVNQAVAEYGWPEGGLSDAIACGIRAEAYQIASAIMEGVEQ